MHRPRGPAYRIETPRTSLRCYTPEDHARLSAAVVASLAHLRPWLDWAQHEPITRDERVEWLRTQRGQFDLGGDYNFGIFDKAQRELWGSALLRMGSDVVEREVGFWIHAGHVQKGLATEATSALVRVAFEIEELEALELRCHPRNEASAGVARRLGFAGPIVDPLSYPSPTEGKIDMHVYTLSRLEYASSPARTLAIEAFDVLGERIL